MTLKTAMEDQRGDKPWYLTDRARWLAYVYLTQDESVHVDDVSDLDIGVDLFVRPGKGREEEDWAMGVVTRGAFSLPAETEKTITGVEVPQSDLDIPSSSDLPDFPILLTFYTMSDDQGYGTIITNAWETSPLIAHGLVVTAASKSYDEHRSFQRLDDVTYRTLINPEVQQFLSSSLNELRPPWVEEPRQEGGSDTPEKLEDWIITALRSRGTSQAD